jgi:hypothetical protein
MQCCIRTKEFFAVYRKQLQVQLRADGGLVARTLDLHPRQTTMPCAIHGLEERKKTCHLSYYHVRKRYVFSGFLSLNFLIAIHYTVYTVECRGTMRKYIKVKVKVKTIGCLPKLACRIMLLKKYAFL